MYSMDFVVKKKKIQMLQLNENDIVTVTSI